MIHRALDYTWPVLTGLAAILHAIVGTDRMALWLRSNPEHEPEVVA